MGKQPPISQRLQMAPEAAGQNGDDAVILQLRRGRIDGA